jgi:hypothetical protein
MAPEPRAARVVITYYNTRISPGESVTSPRIIGLTAGSEP